MRTKTTIYCDGAASMKCVNGEYIRENGVDIPEVVNFKWHGKEF